MLPNDTRWDANGRPYIFRPYFKCSKTNRIIYAKAYGKRAFKIYLDG